MALDSKRYDVAAFEKAQAAWNDQARRATKKGKSAPTPLDKNKFLLPGAAPDKAGDVSGYDPRFGGIPGVPDPTATAGSAITGNLANFGDLEALTGKTNTLLFDQYTNRLPDYNNIASASSANILSNLRGEIPPDVLNLIGQQAAERGISAGVSGSDFSNTDYLRTLGLTSLDLKTKGEAGFTGATDRLKGVPMFDPATMFTKPEDIFGADLQRNIFASAPQPSAANAYNLNMAKLPFDEAEKRRLAAAPQGKWITNPNFGIGDHRGQIWSG